MVKWGCAVAGLMVGAMPMAAAAQEQAAQPAAQGAPQAAAPQSEPGEAQDADATGEDIVVNGVLRGAVPGDIKPEVQLNPAEIRAYGASNLSELVGQLSAQLGSGQGRGGEQPVILLSGRRSSLGEIRDLPPEAVERIDILPEEVALKYGYAPTQKVINFVLRRRFQALTAEVEGRAATDGGNAGGRGEAIVNSVQRDTRVTLGVRYDQSSGILESERGVSRATAAGTATDPDNTDLSPYRTLVSPQKRLEINGVYRRALSDKISATFNGQVQGTESSALLGLPSATLTVPATNPFATSAQDAQVLRYLTNVSPLTRANSGRTYSGELIVNGDGTPWANSWRWSATGSYNANVRDSETDTGIDAAPLQALLNANDPSFNPYGSFAPGVIRTRPDDTSHSRTTVGQIDALTNGPLFSLPAGKANASIRVSGQTRDIASDSFRRGIAQATDISRDTASIRGNIDLPIASRRTAVLDAIGDLSLNANIQVEQLSDFGNLVSTGYGFNWTPIPEIRTIFNWTQDRNAPSDTQLGDPAVFTPNVRIFDYVRGESVDVTTITGGNPLLRADTRNVFKIGLNVRPLSETNLTLVVNYANQHYRNTAGAFPGPTAEVEAAFPDRFTRDGSGQLLSVDYRPINFDRYDHEELRWGFNLFLPIASPAQKRMQARRNAFREAMQESRRTGQPLPPEMQAQLDQFRRIGQQQSLFGGNQRGPGQGGGGRPGEGQGQPPQGDAQGQAQGQQQGGEQARPEGGPGGGRFGGPGGGFGGRGPGGGGGFGGRGGGGGGNTVQLSVYHTWVFRDERVIRAGLPALDYLNGAASGSAGGTPRHRIEFQTGVQRDGFRLRLEGNWLSGTQVNTGALGSDGALNFGSLATVNLVAQADLGQQIDLLLKHPWLRGTRVSLRVDNLFNARQRVTDESGVTPTAYAPNLRDPLGRVVRLSLRKLIF